MATAQPPDGDRLLAILLGTILGLVRQADRDLTARQLAVFLVCYNESEPQTVRGLAEKLKVHKPAITRALDRLEEERLIRRKRDPHDNRSVLTMHTAAGQGLFLEMKQIVVNATKAAGQSRTPAPQAE